MKPGNEREQEMSVGSKKGGQGKNRRTKEVK